MDRLLRSRKIPGSYDVFVQTTGEDGGAYRLYVDDKLVLDNWTLNKALANYVTLPLEAGAHKVVLEHRGRSQWLGGRLKTGNRAAPANMLTRKRSNSPRKLMLSW